jgi:hypothetical protein
MYEMMSVMCWKFDFYASFYPPRHNIEEQVTIMRKLKTAINGNDVRDELKIMGGKLVGKILAKVRDFILMNPELNEKEILLKKIHDFI